MDIQLKEFVEKAKNTTVYATDIATRVGKELYVNSKINLKIFEIKSEVDSIYKEVGKLVYESHEGANVYDEVIAEKLDLISAKHKEIYLLEKKKEKLKSIVECTNCGAIGNREQGNCDECGMRY
ncbi:MAG: hypothetical protein R3Y12_02775 [Clostridia bacterium]